MMEGTIWLRANRRIDFTIVISDSSTYFRAIFILSFFFHLPGKKKILNVNRVNEITVMTNISWNEKVLNYNSLWVFAIINWLLSIFYIYHMRRQPVKITILFHRYTIDTFHLPNQHSIYSASSVLISFPINSRRPVIHRAKQTSFLSVSRTRRKPW